MVSVASGGLLIVSLLLAGSSNRAGLDMLLAAIPLALRDLVNQYAVNHNLTNITDFSRLAALAGRQSRRILWPFSILRHPISRDKRKAFIDRHCDGVSERVATYGKQIEGKNTPAQGFLADVRAALGFWGKSGVIIRYCGHLAYTALKEYLLARFLWGGRKKSQEK